MAKHKLIKKQAGEYTYRGIDIELDGSVAKGYWGYWKTSGKMMRKNGVAVAERAETRQRLLSAIDAILDSTS